MIRHLVIVVLSVCLSTAATRAEEPRVSVELQADSTVVGQPLVLRIKVLVATWLPAPPVFPDLEMPSLMVRLPERASGPVSERIDGETWSGVQRAYRLYPLSEGVFTLPRGDIAITYAEPGKTDPIAYKTALPDISFTATLPAGARTLSPPIVATGFTLEQTVEGETGLSVGDALTRSLVAGIAGTTPVLIPRLSPDIDAGAVRGYPKDPVVTEMEQRGVLSGTRREDITYVAQDDGTVVLPAVSFDWFNLETGAVETVSVPEVTLTITGAAPKPPDATEITRLVVQALIGLAIVWTAFRLLGSRIAGWVAGMRQRWRGSEFHAHRAVVSAMRRRDLSSVMTALENWLRFFPDATAAGSEDLQNALVEIGQARFGPQAGMTATTGWPALENTYRQTRKTLRTSRRDTRARKTLPSLNPWRVS